MTCERSGNMVVCSRGQRLSTGKTRQQSRAWAVGDRVVAKVGDKTMPSVVLQAKASIYAGAQNIKLKVAEKNHLTDQWLIYELRDWILGTRLAERDGEPVPGLDD